MFSFQIHQGQPGKNPPGLFGRIAETFTGKKSLSREDLANWRSSWSCPYVECWRRKNFWRVRDGPPSLSPSTG